MKALKQRDFKTERPRKRGKSRVWETEIEDRYCILQ
jgi:hypothetical protein